MAQNFLVPFYFTISISSSYQLFSFYCIGYYSSYAPKAFDYLLLVFRLHPLYQRVFLLAEKRVVVPVPWFRQVQLAGSEQIVAENFMVLPQVPPLSLPPHVDRVNIKIRQAMIGPHNIVQILF